MVAAIHVIMQRNYNESMQLSTFIRIERGWKRAKKEFEKNPTIDTERAFRMADDDCVVNDELFPAFYPLLGKWFLWLLRHL